MTKHFHVFHFLCISILMPFTCVYAADEKKRPFFVEEAGFEFGLTGSRVNTGSQYQSIFSTPISWTKYQSDDFDLRFEGSLNYVRRQGSSSFSVLAAPGFSYWIDSSISVTPFIRFGYEYIGSTGASLAVLGSDILFEKTMTLNELAPYFDQNYLILGARPGFVAREELSHKFSKRFQSIYGFGNALAALDIPIKFDDASDIYYRGRISSGAEILFGQDRPLDFMLSAAFSVRNIDLKTGKFLNKLELGGALGSDGFFRLTTGISRNF